ncbi:Uncharacterised protein [Legionella bozemanae]|uniref:Uncharacterized protein n=1 Tax=Legionella bozemanae TaxID=447 RepID=A0A0W0RBX7_LEGBO|nr:hypothetical protein Lboz_3373 [Legionella bozemanae]STO33045.1 Uncharacterised protein [Legionella bozemanae]
MLVYARREKMIFSLKLRLLLMEKDQAQYFQSTKNSSEPQVRLITTSPEDEIERIKNIISQKAKKDLYARYKPILLVNLANHPMIFLYDHELECLQKEIKDFVIKNNILEIFTQVVLINIIHTRDYVDTFYKGIINNSRSSEEERIILLYLAHESSVLT